MLKRWRKRSPLLFCLGCALAFLAVMNLAAMLAALLGAAGLFGALAEDEYFYLLLQEAVGSLAAVALLRAAGHGTALRRPGCGYWSSLAAGVYPLGLVVFALSGSVMATHGVGTLRPPLQVAVFMATMFLIGFAEEVLFRGVVANVLLCHYGLSREGIWRATVVSGLVFGAAHLTNLIGGAPLGVLVQCAATSVLGMLLAALYFRTGNLWAPITIHTLMDVAGLWESGVYGLVSATEVVSGYGLINLLPCVIYALPLLVLLQPASLWKIVLYHGDELLPWWGLANPYTTRTWWPEDGPALPHAPGGATACLYAPTARHPQKPDGPGAAP